MMIGYVRPYHQDEQCIRQLAALEAMHCDCVITENHASPKKRVMLEKMMAELKSGDTIVVAKLFSIADSTRHLAELLHDIQEKEAHLHSVQEGIHTGSAAGYAFPDIVNYLLDFQGDVIREHTRKGLDEAKQRGIKPGRPRKPDDNVKRAIEMYQSQKYSLAQIREETGISKTTLYRYLES